MAFNFSQTNKALPLKTRMGIRDNAESFEVSLAAIRTATGIDFAFEVHGDVVAFNKAIDERYEDRLGEIFFGSSSGVLQSLVTCVTNGCADEMVQEDLQDTCSAKLLVFRVKLEERPSGGLYHPLSIENGVLFVDFYTDAVWSNVDEVGWTKLEDVPRA
ncbi:hypothetical protein SPRG_18185 [Saprolegnia parasitica CBS 223.65]|uniref:Uncharacterized protein n=1 Tax=Saprolegnia parasitica (strain CBS 223.65) TaxID=695850 RepID=A0A067BPM8_SAPPC|nr:hypothetical protein SPRG_18185 [Saprolegnia parasitica CBS 223.65]KDO16281.1 hypothetical protein SPRG_18185 [Saprolegnia parasitica CBS 223.65]|eukprot:XP_012213012.1 hypothetical protein SPRG_18185 [Saprolegnia parasitica CBS 223.65]